MDDTEALRLNGTEMAFEWADEWTDELSDEFIKETLIGSTVSWMNLQNCSRIDDMILVHLLVEVAVACLLSVHLHTL